MLHSQGGKGTRASNPSLRPSQIVAGTSASSASAAAPDPGDSKRSTTGTSSGNSGGSGGGAAGESRGAINAGASSDGDHSDARDTGVAVELAELAAADKDKDRDKDRDAGSE